MGSLPPSQATAIESCKCLADRSVDQAAEVCVLASGSKGNAIYLGLRGFPILIDAGLSGIAIQKRMAAKGLDPAELKAIVVTHEHADHVNGVGILSRRFHLPVYISRRTATAAAGQLGKMDDLYHFRCGCPFSIGPLDLHPFATSHDACDPAGFTISCGPHKIGLATDLGKVTAMVKSHLKNCNLLIIEANHDPEMLIQGPYPWPLKQRIKSRLGHLSNLQAMELIKDISHENLRHIILAHLSETNNTPEMARQAFHDHLPHIASGVQLHIACQENGTELIRLEV